MRYCRLCGNVPGLRLFRSARQQDNNARASTLQHNARRLPKSAILLFLTSLLYTAMSSGAQNRRSAGLEQSCSDGTLNSTVDVPLDHIRSLIAPLLE